MLAAMRFLTLHRRFLSDRRGNVAAILAFSLVPLLGATGAAVDYSRTSAIRTSVQAALDMAVLKGANEPAATQVQIAKDAFLAQLRQKGEEQFAPNPSFVLEGDLFKGSVQGSVSTRIVKVLGFEEIPFSVSSAATPKSSLSTVCWLLKTSLKVTSSSQIEMPTCEIAVKSKAAGAAEIDNNSSIDIKRLCVEGTIKAPMMKSNYKEGCPTADDPFAGKLPSPAAGTTCDHRNKTFGGNNPVSILPGTICDGMTFNTSANVRFEPGLHRVRGGPIVFRAAAQVIADGVTFYFEDSNSYIQNQANASFSIKAPTSGPYAGIAMFEKEGLGPSSFGLTAASNGNLEGLFYLPSRDLTLNSSSSIDARRMTLVANSLTMDSSSAIKGTDAPDDSKRIYVGGTRIAY
jgi:Flp pilus assembly protein TadG